MDTTGAEVSFLYKNFRGETSRRTVLPLRRRFTPDGWVLVALDLDRGRQCEFAESGITELEAALVPA